MRKPDPPLNADGSRWVAPPQSNDPFVDAHPEFTTEHFTLNVFQGSLPQDKQKFDHDLAVFQEGGVREMANERRNLYLDKSLALGNRFFTEYFAHGAFRNHENSSSVHIANAKNFHAFLSSVAETQSVWQDEISLNRELFGIPQLLRGAFPWRFALEQRLSGSPTHRMQTIMGSARVQQLEELQRLAYTVAANEAMWRADRGAAKTTLHWLKEDLQRHHISRYYVMRSFKLAPYPAEDKPANQYDVGRDASHRLKHITLLVPYRWRKEEFAIPE